MLVAAVGRQLRRVLLVGAVLALTFAGLPGSAHAVSTSVVISQVYGGGGNSGATLHPRLRRAVQPRHDARCRWTAGRSSTPAPRGTGNFGANSGQLTELPDVSLAPGQYLPGPGGLQRRGRRAAPHPGPHRRHPDRHGRDRRQGRAGRTPRPRSAATAARPPAPPAAAGADRRPRRLRRAPTSSRARGARAAAGNTTAVLRGAARLHRHRQQRRRLRTGGGDTRATQHRHGAEPVPVPTSRSSADCDGPLSTVPGVAASAVVSAADADGMVTSLSITQVTPSPAPGSIVLGGLVPAAGVGGTATATVTVAAGTRWGPTRCWWTPPTTTPSRRPAAARSPSTVVAATAIHDIQGAGHLSPQERPARLRRDRRSSPHGAANGFYLQDPRPDADQATSEAIFVFTSAAPDGGGRRRGGGRRPGGGVPAGRQRQRQPDHHRAHRPLGHRALHRQSRCRRRPCSGPAGASRPPP